jgi:hypothetical protein
MRFEAGEKGTRQLKQISINCLSLREKQPVYGKASWTELFKIIKILPGKHTHKQQISLKYK